VWRPVIEGIFKGESLLDGSVSLADIADANEALDVRAENQRRFQEWHDRHK
jgi:hypothetical protein